MTTTVQLSEHDAHLTHPVRVGSIPRGSLQHAYVPSAPDDGHLSTLCAVTGCGVGVEYHQGPHHAAYLAWDKVIGTGGTQAADVAYAKVLADRADEVDAMRLQAPLVRNGVAAAVDR